MALPVETTDAKIPLDTFAVRLAIVRNQMGWNVLTAATECGLNHTSWNNWESGKGCRDIHKVARKIADRTGFDYTWLVAGGALRSRCLSALPPVLGQMALFSDDGVGISTQPRLRAL